jgi:hypothetical protein
MDQVWEVPLMSASILACRDKDLRYVTVPHDFNIQHESGQWSGPTLKLFMFELLACNLPDTLNFWAQISGKIMIKHWNRPQPNTSASSQSKLFFMKTNWRSRLIVEKLKSSSFDKLFAFHANGNFVTLLTTQNHWFLSYVRWIQPLITSYILKILSSLLWSLKLSVSLGVYNWNLLDYMCIILQCVVHIPLVTLQLY